MSHQFFMSGSASNEAYPIAILTDGVWSISPLFSQDDFSDWLASLDGSELEGWSTDRVIQQYTGNCPECGEAIPYFPEEADDGSDIMSYECNNCGGSGTIEMVEPDE